MGLHGHLGNVSMDQVEDLRALGIQIGGVLRSLATSAFERYNRFVPIPLYFGMSPLVHGHIRKRYFDPFFTGIHIATADVER